MLRGSAEGRGGGSTHARRGVAHGLDQAQRHCSGHLLESDSIDSELERLLDEHREGMVVRIGLRCHHDHYPILCCSWSGSNAGRRYLACPQVLQPCPFKYWINQEFTGRARRVIEDLVSMKQSMIGREHERKFLN
ncbi:hypothetical protein GQ55_5G300800 [Panicum hallii var. hallii]|uniref:Uncharacterized protein n=1 Tax=Panicum hallii var. hallii TaxID=1504633 RepID=A0A2T7DLI3_9POAL|nr:hypothetical protein GQ55_5G300800 [Panicum hallii var. hallii]